MCRSLVIAFVWLETHMASPIIGPTSSTSTADMAVVANFSADASIADALDTLLDSHAESRSLWPLVSRELPAALIASAHAAPGDFVSTHKISEAMALGGALAAAALDEASASAHWTPLHLAARGGKRAACEALLAAEARGHVLEDLSLIHI